MPSRSLSCRCRFSCSVAGLNLLLQALLLLRSFLGFPGVRDTYSLPVPGVSPTSSSTISYPEFQDVNHMVIFGFGFFLIVLRKYGFSSTGFNFLLVVLGVQCSVLAEDLFVFLKGGRNQVGLESLEKALVSVTAVVISTGAVLGKANPVQLIVMTLVELIFLHMSRWINREFLEVAWWDWQIRGGKCPWSFGAALPGAAAKAWCGLGSPRMVSVVLVQVPEPLSAMHVFLFGAYFGLALASRFPEAPPGLDKNRSTPKSELFSVLGTVFVWVFWPSFNSILTEFGKMKAVLNTYLALAVSAVAAFMLSALTSKDGKFRMADIRSAVLAGGVTISYTAQFIQQPWIAMMLGLLASVITILGSHCVQRCFNPAMKLQDTSGVHFTFGLPAVLGAVAAVVIRFVEDGIDLQWNELSRLGYDAFVNIGAFCQTISTALITGLITGLILNIKLLKAVHVSKYFDDQSYWEFPHLAVGF